MTKDQQEIGTKIQRGKEDGFNDLAKFTKAVMDLNNYPYELPDGYTTEKYLQALNYVLMGQHDFGKEFENERKTKENNNPRKTSR